MLELEENFKQDVANIQNIAIVSKLLSVLCQTTGLGFAAVARVTESRWICCSVEDHLGFGLKPGDELEIKTTICDTIRQNAQPVIIDNVSQNLEYRNHEIPAMYNFQSYISVPIINQNGSFFGTLCALDPKPNELSSFKVREMFALFAELISFHIAAIEKEVANKKALSDQTKLLTETLIQKNEAERLITVFEKELIAKNISLEQTNNELEAFNYISSHDLQEPLRKIQFFTDIIENDKTNNLSEKSKNAFNKIRTSAFRMQNLITDLLTYSKTKFNERKFELTDFNTIVNDVMEDFSEELQSKKIIIDINALGQLPVIKFQFRQLFYNLISNSIKFSYPERKLLISVTYETINSSQYHYKKLAPETQYGKITI